MRNSFISLLLLVLCWQAIVLVFQLPTYILPAPKSVLLTFIQSWQVILYQAAVTFFEALFGLLLGALSGIIIAILLIMVRPIKLFLLPLMLISQALPIFAIAPLLVLWLGFGTASKIIVVMLMTFFPIASSLFDGLNKTPHAYLEMAHAMRGKKIPILRYLYLPYALSFLASGLRVSAVFAPMGAIISEWVGASRGLGYLMINANAHVNTSLVFAAIIVLTLMALGLYYTLDVFLKRKITW